MSGGSVLSRLTVLLHDVSSAQRLIDMVKLAYGLGVKVFLVSKVYGAAASSGVPEANRLALKLGRVFAVLPSARDAVEIVDPEKTFVVSYDYGEPLSLNEAAERVASVKGRILLVFGGIDPAPGKDVAGIGDAIYIRGVSSRLGPVAEAALLLYALAGLEEA